MCLYNLSGLPLRNITKADPVNTRRNREAQEVVPLNMSSQLSGAKLLWILDYNQIYGSDQSESDITSVFRIQLDHR